eukprot:205719_1
MSKSKTTALGVQNEHTDTQKKQQTAHPYDEDSKDYIQTLKTQNNKAVEKLQEFGTKFVDYADTNADQNEKDDDQAMSRLSNDYNGIMKTIQEMLKLQEDTAVNRHEEMNAWKSERNIYDSIDGLKDMWIRTIRQHKAKIRHHKDSKQAV